MEVHDYLKAGAVSVVQSDPKWCGGITELVKTCTIASLFDAQVIPHGHKYSLVPVPGRIALPERAGFGIEFEDGKVEKRTLLHWS
jgi:L-rhamnonate dehydratase